MTGVWAPNWLFDVICMEKSIGDELVRRADVQLREVAWHRSPLGDALQLMFASTAEHWFDEDELTRQTSARHGVSGTTCAECGRWKWMPLSADLLPPVRVREGLRDVAIAASPEWFGDGGVAYREVLVRRDLAEFLHETSPRDFDLK
ncbi:hypothetical protein ACYEXT_00565 [Microbacterium sp. MAH-37]|uniref:hypothetical protein n=1 Tax=Microbacterium sp. MAH-37 TaxID=2682846 RepID=UPI0018E02B72|nr:hypothetical protein [Microbacterium sp. MAH-37]